MVNSHPDLVIRNVRVFDPALTANSADPVDIVVADGQIVALGPTAADSVGEVATIIDGSGHLAIPGLVNTHLHSSGNFMKGAVPSLPLELFMLYEVPPLMRTPVEEEYAYARTLLGAVEMLKQGVTSVHDDAYYLPIATRTEINAVMRAYEAAGIRATVTIDQPNVPEYDKHPFFVDRLDRAVRQAMDATPVQSDAELLDLYRWFFDNWHGSANGRLRVATSCSAPQRVTADYLLGLDKLSLDYDAPYNMHILETRSQRVFGDQRYGSSLVQYARSMGVLSDRAHVIHAIWVTDEDIAILAGEGAKVAHNPTCNLRLGSGVMPFRALADSGVPIGIGTDEANTDDGINFWSAVKNTGLVHTLTTSDYTQWPTPAEILTAATVGGHAALRTPGRAGVLDVGALADIVLMDLATLPFTPLNDVARQLVYAEPASTVRTVIVDGRVVVKDGRCTLVDETALLNQIAELQPQITAFLESCQLGAATIWDLYDQSYRRCSTEPMPVSRRLG